MEQLEAIKRQRLFSDAITQAQEKMAYENISVDVRPLEDPQEPPQLSLQLQADPFQDNDTQQDYFIQNNYGNQQTNRKIDRARSQSLDVTFTILQFMERKIRQRGMSQQLSPTYVKNKRQQK